MVVDRVNGASLTGNADITITETLKGAGESNEIQSFNMLAATAGTYKLKYVGVFSSTLQWNSTAAEIETALEGIGAIGTGNVDVFGGDGSDDAKRSYFVVFKGALLGQNVAQIQIDASALTGSVASQLTVNQQGGVAAKNDEWQLLDFGGATSGTFTLTFDGKTTSAINVVGTGLAATSVSILVKDALEALSNIDGGDVGTFHQFSSTSPQGVVAVKFTGALANTNVSLLQMSTAGLVGESGAGVTLMNSGGGGIKEKQSIAVFATGGTFTLSFGGDTTSAITFGASAATVTTRIETDFSTVADVTVTGTGTPEDPYIVEFVDPGTQDVALMTFNAASLTGGDGQSTETTAAAAAVNEIQTVTVNAAVTSGNFTLGFGGVITIAIAYDAAAATVDTDLTNLSTIDAITVTGAAGGPFTVTFDSAALKELDVAMLVADGTNLVGGAGSEGFAVATTTASAGPNHVDDPDNYAPAGLPASTDDLFIVQAGGSLLYGLNALSAVTLNSLDISARFEGTVGLPRITESGYVEYRDRYLQVGVNPGKLTIGNRDGSGSSRINVDVGSVQMDAEVFDSGASSEPGLPAVLLLATHADNELLVLEGEVGVALQPGETSTVKNVDQHGGSLELGTVTVTNLVRSDGELRAYNVTITSGSLQIE